MIRECGGREEGTTQSYLGAIDLNYEIIWGSFILRIGNNILSDSIFYLNRPILTKIEVV